MVPRKMINNMERSPQYIAEDAPNIQAQIDKLYAQDVELTTDVSEIEEDK